MAGITEYLELIRKYPYLILRDEPLNEHMRFKIGGKADLFCELDDPQVLISLLKDTEKLRIPRVIIGGGSNILADDRGFRGLVIKYCSTKEPYIEENAISISAGITLEKLLEFAAQNSFTGLEFMAGIPGTLGGAVYMNAGAYGCTISEVCYSASIINENYEIMEVLPEYFKFGYRYSILQETPAIVTDVKIIVKNGNEEEIRSEYNRILAIRASKHPSKHEYCAGSYFKNLPPENPGEHRIPAGKYLDLAGAKGLRIGGAAVYEKHANIIVNDGSATAENVLGLAERMKNIVNLQFGIELQPEVRFLDHVNGFIK